MFEFNSKTYVNRQFKMKDLYKQMNADKEVRTDGRIISGITLVNVLSNDTMNYRIKGNVKEIYIFEIGLTEKRIPSLFISCLDKAINLNTFFILKYGDEQMLYGAYKEKTEKGLRFGKYYGTDWNCDKKDIPLPLTISGMDDLYAALFNQLIPINAREGETALELIARYEAITALEKAVGQKQKRMNAEKQPKFKFEIYDELQSLKHELSSLKGE